MKIFEPLFRREFINLLKRKDLLNFVLGAIDLFSLMVIFQISFYFLHSREHPVFLLDIHYLLLFIYMVPSWILVLHICNLAQIPRTSRYSRLFFEYLQFTVLNVVVFYIYYYVFKLDIISHGFVVLFALNGMLILYSVRIMEYKVFKMYRASGYNYVNLILIADGSSELFINDLLTKKEWAIGF